MLGLDGVVKTSFEILMQERAYAFQFEKLMLLLPALYGQEHNITGTDTDYTKDPVGAHPNNATAWKQIWSPLFEAMYYDFKYSLKNKVFFSNDEKKSTWDLYIFASYIIKNLGDPNFDVCDAVYDPDDTILKEIFKKTFKDGIQKIHDAYNNICNSNKIQQPGYHKTAAVNYLGAYHSLSSEPKSDMYSEWYGKKKDGTTKYIGPKGGYDGRNLSGYFNFPHGGKIINDGYRVKLKQYLSDQLGYDDLQMQPVDLMTKVHAGDMGDTKQFENFNEKKFTRDNAVNEQADFAVHESQDSDNVQKMFQKKLEESMESHSKNKAVSAQTLATTIMNQMKEKPKNYVEFHRPVLWPINGGHIYAQKDLNDKWSFPSPQSNPAFHKWRVFFSKIGDEQKKTPVYYYQRTESTAEFPFGFESLWGKSREAWQLLKKEWFKKLCSHGACGKCKENIFDPSSKLVDCGDTLQGLKVYEGVVDQLMLKVINETN